MKDFTNTTKMKLISLAIGTLMTCSSFANTQSAANISTAPNFSTTHKQVENGYTPDLSQGADNFYNSELLNVQKVSFLNQYNMKVVGNLFTPKNMPHGQTYPAIVVGHPMGATKEQSSNLYAQKLAEQGFITLAIDLSYWGESEGEPRHLVAPEVYTDDFSAAVNFLTTQDFIQKEHIGVLGICGSGSFVINAAKIDPRMKAIATVSMYNMGDAARYGLNKSVSDAARQDFIQAMITQKQAEFSGADKLYIPGTVNELTEDADAVTREFYDFYRTKRGEYTPAGDDPITTTQPLMSSFSNFLNFRPFEGIETIAPRPMLFITGDKAHSIEFSQDAYQKAAQPKELYLVKGAGHVDLYDRTDLIPFTKLTDFFKQNLQ